MADDEYMTYQMGLDGTLYPPQTDDLQARVAWVLAAYPDTRENDVLLTVRCWQMYDDLEEALGTAAFNKLVVWAKEHPTSPETYRRRRQEMNRLRDKSGALRPDARTVAIRRKRDGAGPPWRRR